MTPRQIRRLISRFDAGGRRYKVVSPHDAVAIISGLPAGTKGALLARTAPGGLRKAGDPRVQGCRVVKRRSVVFNASYEDEVNRARARERKPADFEAGPRAWGVREGATLVSHRPGLYISCQVLKDLGTGYFDRRMRPIPPERVEPHLGGPRKPPEAQGLRRPVAPRDYKLENVLSFDLPRPSGREAGYIIDHEGDSR